MVDVRVFPDYGADPVWADTAMVELGTLPISDVLCSRLRQWAREWEDLMGVSDARYAIADEAAHESWRQRGTQLAARLQRELGNSYRVQYEEWPSDEPPASAPRSRRRPR